MTFGCGGLGRKERKGKERIFVCSFGFGLDLGLGFGIGISGGEREEKRRDGDAWVDTWVEGGVRVHEYNDSNEMMIS